MQAATHVLEREARRPRAELTQRCAIEVGAQGRERRLALASALDVELFAAAVGCAQARAQLGADAKASWSETVTIEVVSAQSMGARPTVD